VGGERRLKASRLTSHGVLASARLIPLFSKTLIYIVMPKTSIYNNLPFGVRFRMLVILYLWTLLRVSFNAYLSILVAI
jgi:hypothetical protein